MKYFKDNKQLILKYIYIFIMNILLFILCSFYFKSSQYKYLIMLLLNIISNMFIYYYKGTLKFKIYLDFILNILLSLILIIFINNSLDYCSVVFSLLFSNNIIFIRSRLSDNFIKRSIQYLMMFISSLLVLFIATFIFILIKKYL